MDKVLAQAVQRRDEWLEIAQARATSIIDFVAAVSTIQNKYHAKCFPNRSDSSQGRPRDEEMLYAFKEHDTSKPIIVITCTCFTLAMNPGSSPWLRCINNACTSASITGWLGGVSITTRKESYLECSKSLPSSPEKNSRSMKEAMEWDCL